MSSKAGYIGLFGSIFVLFAFFSMAWASLDPSATFESWFALSVQFVGGLSLATAFGFRIKRNVSMEDEFMASVWGLIGGMMAISTQIIVGMIAQISSFSSYGESVWLIILAPIAETFAFVIAPYEVIRLHFPNLTLRDAIVIAIASDIAFALYHFFAYASRSDFMLILIILMISNTVFVLMYHGTRNAITPMISHLAVNMMAEASFVVLSIQTILPVFILIAAGMLFLYFFIGETLEVTETWI
jgi:membrane protease YdiL (CAAX protease family)